MQSARQKLPFLISRLGLPKETTAGSSPMLKPNSPNPAPLGAARQCQGDIFGTGGVRVVRACASPNQTDPLSDRQIRPDQACLADEALEEMRGAIERG